MILLLLRTTGLGSPKGGRKQNADEEQNPQLMNVLHDSSLVHRVGSDQVGKGAFGRVHSSFQSISGLVILGLLTSGCASVRGGWRLAIGTGGGAAIGGTSGALLAPNDENRALNALVFGLGGALLGGATAYVTDPTPTQAEGPTLRERELGVRPQSTIPASAGSGLPEFVRERLSPVVIEEAVERDQVSDDGTLHEPHRIYRILKPAELNAQPTHAAQEAQ